MSTSSNSDLKLCVAFSVVSCPMRLRYITVTLAKKQVLGSNTTTLSSFWFDRPVPGYRYKCRHERRLWHTAAIAYPGYPGTRVPGTMGNFMSTRVPL
eukprot:1402117-Rhodomonas_salina.1